MVSEKHKVIFRSGHSFNYDGVFDLNRLYSEINKWINGNNYEFQEKEHFDKVRDKGHEIKYYLLGKKKVTDYIRYNIMVDIFAIQINKMSENLVSGKLNIVFNANVELDYKNKWGISRLSKFFFNFYNNYLIRNEIEEHLIKLYDETVDLQDLAKDVLDFNR